MTAQLAGDLALELLKAHKIILGMLEVMPREQRLALHDVLDAVGSGSLRCITRIDARRVALARAGYRLGQDDQIIVQPTDSPAGHWCIKLVLSGGTPLYLMHDDDVNSMGSYVFDKSRAKCMTFEEATTCAAKLVVGPGQYVVIVSVGGQS